MPSRRLIAAIDPFFQSDLLAQAGGAGSEDAEFTGWEF